MWSAILSKPPLPPGFVYGFGGFPVDPTLSQVNLLPQLRTMDIHEAWALGVDIRTVNLDARSYCARRLELLRSFRVWADRCDALLFNSSSSSGYTYGGPAYNGRTLHGREFTTIEYYSGFSLVTSNDDGYLQKFRFEYFSGFENHIKHKPSNTLSMLQITYGLMKKYDGLIHDVRGFMPKSK